MRVSICDDDPLVLCELERLISYFFREREESFQIECHADPIHFLDSAKTVLPDVAFIDLIMGKMEGFEVARELRRISLDPEIVFVTSYPLRMPGAFEFKPVAFITKPVSQESVEAALETITTYHWSDGLSYLVHVKAEWLRVPHKEIEYFESKQHRVLIHLTGKNAPVSFSGKLDDVETELKGLPYVRCHKSYIIQIPAIRSLDKAGSCFITVTGDHVAISRRNCDQAIHAFLHSKI